MPTVPGPSLAAALVLASSSWGCSFFAVYGPTSSQKPAVDVSCTEERYAPALDVAQAGAALAYATGADINAEARAGLVSSALVYGGSAFYGYTLTMDCQKAKDAAHRYHTKLLLRQIDLLNEAAAKQEPSGPSAPAEPAEEAPVPPAAPVPPEAPASPIQ